MFTTNVSQNSTHDDRGKGKGRRGETSQSSKSYESYTANNGKGKQAKQEVKLVTPGFNTVGVQPTVLVQGHKELKESLVVMVLQPGNSIPDAVSIHRPLGLTKMDPAKSWVATRSSALPGLLTEADHDRKAFNDILRTEVDKATVAGGTMLYHEVSGKKTCVYGPTELEAMKNSIGYGGTALALTMKAAVLQAEKARELPAGTVAIYEKLCNHLDTHPECARSAVKTIITDYLESYRKSTLEYEDYLVELKEYASLTKHEKNRKKQPKAPAAAQAWTMFVPQVLRDIEIARDKWSRDNKDSILHAMLEAGTVKATKDPLSRNEQIGIEKFEGLSLNEIQGRLFGFLHFGEDL